jgi:hypothetical protein
MRAAMLCLLMMPAAAAANVALLMTAPETPVAGQPTTLVFSAVSHSYDLDPSTSPTLSVDGDTLRVDLNVECNQIYCDVFDVHTFRVQLPALAEGGYRVRVFTDASSTTVLGELELTVGAAATSLDFRPAEGFWTDPARPGTGLFLQHRGDLVAVAQFDQVQGAPLWRLDAAPLQARTLLLTLREHRGGSCFDCDPHALPTMSSGGDVLRMRFESARRAYADLSDGSTLNLVSLPFGAAYIETPLPDRADAEFAPLPLPDLAGTWALRDRVFTLGPATASPNSDLRFSSTSEAPEDRAQVDCHAGSVTEPAFCTFAGPGPDFSLLPRAPLGDIEEGRIRFVSPLWPEPVSYAVRVPTPD